MSKPAPTDPDLWQQALSQARKRFRVYPSAYCVPVASAEALTRDGWKRRCDLNEGDEIAAYDITSDRIVFTEIVALHDFSNQQIVSLKSEGLNYSYECTPNHKVVLGYDHAWSEELGDCIDGLQEVYSTAQRVISGDLTYAAAKKVVPSIQHYARRYQGVEFYDFSLNTESRLPSLREVDGLPGQNGFLVVSAIAEDGVEQKNSLYIKYQTDMVRSVLSMTTDQRRAFLMGALMCDGWQGNKAAENVSYGFRQKNIQHRDAVELAAFLTGHMVTRSTTANSDGCWDVRIKTRRTIGCSGLSIVDAGKTTDVWCPETRYGTWVMRQGLTITITGNSNAWASKWYKSKGGGWRASKTEEVERSGKWDVTHKDLPDGRMELIHHPSGKRRVLGKPKAKKLRTRIDQVRRMWDQAGESKPAPFKNVHKHIDSVLTQCCLGRMTEDLMLEEYRGGLRKWFREKWVDISRKKKGGGHPECGASAGKKERKGGSAAYPKCRPAAKASSMSDKEKKASVQRKRKAGNPGGKPNWVK